MSLTCRAEYDLNGVGERTVADASERCDLELVKVVGTELGDNLLRLPSVDDDRAASGSARRHAAPVDTITPQSIDRHTHTHTACVHGRPSSQTDHQHAAGRFQSVNSLFYHKYNYDGKIDSVRPLAQLQLLAKRKQKKCHEVPVFIPGFDTLDFVTETNAAGAVVCVLLRQALALHFLSTLSAASANITCLNYEKPPPPGQPEGTQYMGRNHVTESMVTIRAPFCGYNLACCVELMGED